MNKANFFIVGAPKCGTTALSEYLRSHPAIFMSTPKEPNYFCFDLPGLQYISKPKDYERLFSSSTATQSMLGEASPSYLFSHQAMAEIHKYNPDAQIIVMLRNPTEMLPSYHSQLVYSAYEDQADFCKAWKLQSERLRGNHIPKACREPMALQYSEVATFADQLERVFAIFQKEKVLILFFDDFKKDPKKTYEDVLGFLHLPSDSRTEFPIVNPNKIARSERFNNLLHNPPKWALSIMSRLSGSALHDFLIKLHSILKNANTEQASRAPLDPEFLAEITNAFYSQVLRVEQLTGRNLDSWKQ